jgi:4'-phosphopantetheinyl transferase
VGITLRLTSLEHCRAATESLAWCSTAELERAQTIASASRRVQFLAGRWFARECLSERYGGHPGDWELNCAPGRSPTVEHGPARPSVSLSHRLDALVCAIAPSPVGVDVEVEVGRGGTSSDTDGLAELILSAAETERYARTALAERAAHLRALWTLKEAWAKARGQGLELAELRLLAARAAQSREANARLWIEGKVTVALFAQDPRALVRLDAAGLRQPANVQTWRVERVGH